MSRDLDVHAPVSRRRALTLLGGALAMAVSSHTLRGGASTPDQTATDEAGATAPPVADARRYRGTATTTLAATRFTHGEEQSTQHGVEVTVTPVAATGDGRTPFDLTVDGIADRPQAVPGRIVTADVTHDVDGRTTVERYWDILAGDDGVFSGTLRDGDGVANVLSSRRELIPGRPDTMVLVSEAMSGGTTLVGTITSDRIDIDVRGNTVNRFADDLLDGTRPFVTEVRATRVPEA